MAQVFAQHNQRNQLTLTTASDNYTGSGSTAGRAGAASPGSLHKFVKVTSRGDSVQNSLRIFLKFATGPVYSFLKEVPIPAITVVAGQTPAFSAQVPTGEPLPSADWSLSYALKYDDTGIDISETIVDYV